MTMQRRTLLQGLAASGVLGLAGCASTGSANRARVLVVGGGYGGATVAKYVRLFSDQKIDVMLVEPNRQFVSCPMSNLVIGGQRSLADITNPYDGLVKRHGVRLVHDLVTRIDATTGLVTIAVPPTAQTGKALLQLAFSGSPALPALVTIEPGGTEFTRSSNRSSTSMPRSPARRCSL